MRLLVTGSSGHLGEALVRSLRSSSHEVKGLDLRESPFTDHVGDVRDSALLRRVFRGVDVVLHAATLHKPHVVTHSRRAFVETNVVGTLEVLEAALARGVSAVVFTSTTSAFGGAATPAPSAPAVWVTEDLTARPKNIYGVTKCAAEELCELFHRTRGLPVVVLRTSRFFPEADDDTALRRRYASPNLKVNELLYRRLDLEDAVEAHLRAALRATTLGFARYVVSATTPFGHEHLPRLRTAAAAVVRELFPTYEAEYERRGWQMLPGIDRVYVNARARHELDWRPRFDFAHVLARLRAGEDPSSELARTVGSKGYHRERFEDGPYPVEDGTRH